MNIHIKQIAMDIFQGEAVSSFHYPVCLSLYIVIVLYFETHFTNVMLFFEKYFIGKQYCWQ